MMICSGVSVIAILVIMIAGLLFLAERILFALAAYHDAQSKGNPDAMIWALVIGLLGMIPGIIYLCIRGSGRRLVQCANCGYPHDSSDFCCPKCGEKNPGVTEGSPYAQVLASRAKKEMIGGISVLAGGILLIILILMVFSFTMMRFHMFF